MPSIKIQDHLNAEILSANPQVNSGLGKYLKGVPAQLLAGVDFASEFRKDLPLVNPGLRGFALSFSNEVPLGKDNVSLTIAAGAKAMIGVYNRTGMLLFENTFLGTPLKVSAGQAYVAFSFNPSLELGVAGSTGELKFGFNAGTEADIRCYLPFDLTGPSVTLAEASKAVLENFAIPNTVDDLRNMKGLPAGTVACVSGHGHLEIGGAFDFATAFNPLASVNTIARIGKLDIGGGASVSAGFQARVSGDFQMRVQKMEGDAIRLSYHKVAARDLDVSLTAKAGPAITVGDRDLLAMMFREQGGLAGTSEEDLVAAGISKPQLEKIKSAMRAGMSRKLELALSAQFSSMRQDDAAFLYEIDLAALDAEGEGAVAKALSGDLSEMNKLEPELPGHGIRLLQSRLETLRKKKVSWRVNLVGIVNIVSMAELVRTGTIFHDEESGELLITDKVTTEHVGAVTDSKNIRKLLYESAMMTLSYKASGLDVNTDLKAAQSFFFFDKSANRQRMSDFLDAVAAVGLMDADDVETQLGSSDDFGKASLLLESTYDAAACERMFSDAGQARDEDFYEEIGRSAMLALVQPRDPDSYRRIPLSDGNLWKQMKDTGQPGFRFILPPPITGGASETIRIAVVSADYTLIVWWASAMANAAAELSSMREFLNGRDATKLSKDKEFLKKREQVEKSIVKSVQKNKSSFDDPWGLVALFLAALRTGEVSATVVSPKLTLLLPE